MNNSHKAMNIGYGKNTKGVKDELLFLVFVTVKMYGLIMLKKSSYGRKNL